jgi:hypothetical protein
MMPVDQPTDHDEQKDDESRPKRRNEEPQLGSTRVTLR